MILRKVIQITFFITLFTDADVSGKIFVVSVHKPIMGSLSLNANTNLTETTESSKCKK